MKNKLLLVLLAVCTSLAPVVARNKDKKKKKGKQEAAAPAPDKKKDIAANTKSCKAYPGLFTIYQDTSNGDLMLKVPADKLSKEFIYFSQTGDAASQSGYFRGSYRGSKIFKAQRYFDRIELQVENTGFYYDSTNAISKAANANVNTPIIYSEKIIAQDSTGFLIKANDLFLGEAFNQVKPSSFPGGSPFQFNIGSISKERSKVLKIKNYPENTDVVVSIAFNNPYPVNGGDRSTTDARFVNVQLYHSIIAMPENDYQPRFDDPRIGYFTTQVDDMTNLSSKPYRDVIHRWHLKKKNPNAAISDPVEPITWWIENTTPVEFRETIRTAVLRWNKVYEKAGFSNAVVVNIQSDTATWDAGDIRYNVLRWTSSPNPPFGGYGPSFVNPRTGQILGADIMLEYVYFGNIMKRLDRFERAGLDYLDAEEQHFEPNACFAGAAMHNQLVFGLSSIKARGLNPKDSADLVRQSLSRLVLHEVGHTLGLNHNMKGSSIFSPAELKNKQRLIDGYTSNSIMEYPAINNALNPADQVQYYDEFCGPYDDWAIEFGYSTALSDPSAEQARLAKILSKSSNPLLAFGNDADDMRSNGNGIDPRVNIYDLSSDPVAYGAERIQLVNELLAKLKEKYTVNGDNFHEMRSTYLALTGEMATQLRVMTRQIGGVYVDRSFIGTELAGAKPYTPVPYAVQKEAMKQLKKYAFGVGAFNEPVALYNYLQQQRRGFNLFGAGEDPKIHDRILAVQEDLFGQLLHENVLNRITNSAVYGNQYKIDEYLNDLSSAIIDEDIAGKVSTIRQNLQIEYVKRLANIIASKNYDYVAQSNALLQLQNIKRKVAAAVAADGLTKAHRAHLNFIIAKALETK